MRLTERQREAIRAASAEVFGPHVQVKLFGSRLDDTAKGGDIDLLVESDRPLEDAGVLAAQFAARIQRRIGERKIDVIWIYPGMQKQAVHEVAQEKGMAV